MHTATLPLPLVAPTTPWAKGVAVGLAAASIGALYTVFARWGIQHGLHSTDLTALRFGVAGLLMLPVMAWAWRQDAADFRARWRIWLGVALLAGTPFGLLMFGALGLAPASHAGVFPFAAMSVAGLLLSRWVLGDRFALRKGIGLFVILAGLLVLSGVSSSSLQGTALWGDALFILAGFSWAGFGILLRKYRLDPLRATAVISTSALLSYVPVYLLTGGGARLLAAAPEVLWTEVLVQGVVAGVGTLLSYARLVSLLGPARAAVFPALAPGLATLLAWPVLGHQPTGAELLGLAIVMGGLLTAVIPPKSTSP